jgi:predicted nicotinamide N-methyase
MFGEDGLGRLWVARFAAGFGGWVLLIALMSWAWSVDPGILPWVVAARFAPRALLLALPAQLTSRISPRWRAFLLAAEAAIVFVVAVFVMPGAAFTTDARLLIAVAGLVGVFASLDEQIAYRFLEGLIDPRGLGTASATQARIDRGAMFAGSVSGAFLVWFVLGVPDSSVVAAFALSVAAILAASVARDLDAVQDESDGHTRAPVLTRATLPYQAAALGSGALAGVLLVATARIHPLDAAYVLCLVGLGMLLGPLPVPRLLLRVPALALIGMGVVALVLLALGVFSPLSPAALVLLGLVAVTLDSVRAIALRRLSPLGSYVASVRVSGLALSGGVVIGALVTVLGSPSWDRMVPVVLVAVGLLLVVAGALAIAGPGGVFRVGGLSTLPIKSVVHTLSWETVPDPTKPDFIGSSPRVQRLVKWLNRTAEMQRLEVTLPISKRKYVIHRPTDDSRELLFDAGRADPDKQMPYWAKVWPSGVALADVVVERAAKLKGQHVLELGAGLGVTAAAVLEAGADLVTADYGMLPLAFCRLNTLVNTGHVPRAMCFNWRHDAEVEAATRRPEFRDGFPLILAADVLYEGRDAEPLLNVIERLLTADGELWLAEPVRRTAQRFLDSAASLGWDIESRQVRADWPDATSGPVNLHFLRRSAEPDRILGDLGGWRI